MKKKIKLLYLINSLSLGGAEKNLIDLSNGLIKTKKLEISIISLGEISENYKKNINKKITIHELSIKNNLIKSFISLLILFKRIKPDIVHTWLYVSDFIGTIVSKLLNYDNIIWSIRCSDSTNYLNRISKIILQALIFLSKKVPRYIISNSYSGAKDHIKLGYNKHKIVTIHNGYRFKQPRLSKTLKEKIRKEYFNISKNTILIGTVGRDHAMKDHINFVLAASEVCKIKKNIKFVILGSGITKNENLKKLILNLKLQNKFYLIENIKKYPIQSFYQTLDLFCLTSKSEGFSNVLAESVINKTLSISTKAGDSELILNNKKLIIPRISDPISLYKKIIYAITLSPSIKKIFIQKCFENIKNFSETRTIDSYLKIYKKVIYKCSDDNLIKVIPINKNFNSPGDRRRFSGYLDIKKIPYVLPKSSQEGKLVFLTQGADITSWEKNKYAYIIYDLTDSYLAIRKLNFKGWLRGLAKFFSKQHKYLQFSYWTSLENMCRRANMVICSTKEQKKTISKYNKNVKIILDMKDREAGSLKKTNYKTGKIFNLVWEGLPQNIYLLEGIAEVICELSKKYKIRINLISDPKFYLFLNKYFQKQTDKFLEKIFKDKSLFRFIEWKAETYFKHIVNSDLAIIPTDLNDSFISGKPQNKLLLFWRLGVPVITSKSSAYKFAMHEAGLKNYCENNFQWMKEIEKMITSENLRVRNATLGYKYANYYYGNRNIINKWNAIMKITKKKLINFGI
jgi:glycosyltransferase involved in cell wall biosynthesis